MTIFKLWIPVLRSCSTINWVLAYILKIYLDQNYVILFSYSPVFIQNKLTECSISQINLDLFLPTLNLVIALSIPELAIGHSISLLTGEK
jgi:hypothetical protein